MDLHFTGAQATPAERAAVDSVLGKPVSGWDGGGLRPELVAHTANGHAGCKSQRHHLLPTLHAIQSQIGWISPGAVNYEVLRLDVIPAEVYGVASFYGLF